MQSIIESYGSFAWALSSKEYEQDYMHYGFHPGWKSLIETNKALYDFFNIQMMFTVINSELFL